MQLHEGCGITWSLLGEKKSRLLHAQSPGQTLLSHPCRSLIRASSTSPAAPQLPRNVAKFCSSHLRSQTDVTTRSCHTEATANLQSIQSAHTAPVSLGCLCWAPTGAALCSKAVPVSLTHTPGSPWGSELPVSRPTPGYFPHKTVFPFPSGSLCLFGSKVEQPILSAPRCCLTSFLNSSAKFTLRSPSSLSLLPNHLALCRNPTRQPDKVQHHQTQHFHPMHVSRCTAPRASKSI